jgi:hypothetical protein
MTAPVRFKENDLKRAISGAQRGGMARLLLIIFPADRAALWLRSPNKSLEGRAAVELLLGRDVDDLAHLINYLEYWAYNGW